MNVINIDHLFSIPQCRLSLGNMEDIMDVDILGQQQLTTKILEEIESDCCL